MSRRLRSVATLALSLLLLLPHPDGEARDHDQGETHRLAVRTTAAVPLSTAETHDRRGEWQFIEVSGYETVEEAVAALEEELPGVQVEPERIYEMFGPENEPLFGHQWHHRNTGQEGGTPGADIGSLTAWQRSLGSGVVIAVIDSGVDIDHQDLADQVLTNVSYDFVNDTSDPRPKGSSLDDAHGTEVAGTIAAAVNGVGVTGVAPSAKIMALRACDNTGCWSLDVMEAIVWAVDQGADIINMSIGVYATGDPFVESAIDYAEANGVLVVAAAGNDEEDIDDLPAWRCGGGSPCLLIPAGLPNSNILSVAASTRTDGLAAFSNYGAVSVDLAAPGVQIATTWVDNEYGFSTGTSFSAPVAAGVAALMIARDGAKPPEVIARLTAFVDKKSAFTDRVVSGGRISAANALTKRFIDTSGSVFVNDIDWLADRRITRGCNPPENHRFCPSRQLTRGEMAAFMARALNLPASSTNHFTDDNGHIFEGDINRIADAGITRGCNPPDNTRFCPDRLITRGEMAAFIARAFALPASSTNHFTDDNGHVFENDINRLADSAVTRGCNPPTNDRFCPERLLTRAEMAAFIKRAVQLTG